MTVPLFIKVQDKLLNVAHIEAIYVEDETLHAGTAAETHEFEYSDAAQAGLALQHIQQFLAAKNLVIGEVT